jgi:hypothetical protein
MDERDHPDSQDEIVILLGVDDVCDWLGTSPSLDSVAAEIRRLETRVRDGQMALELLRQHVLTKIGLVNEASPMWAPGLIDFNEYDPEPF